MGSRAGKGRGAEAGEQEPVKVFMLRPLRGGLRSLHPINTGTGGKLFPVLLLTFVFDFPPKIT